MVSTYPASVRLWVRKYLAERDGERCAVCGASSAEVPLEIDHIDGDPGNWDPGNLRLLCHRDNVREFWRKIKQRAKLQPPAKTASSEALAQAEQLNSPQDNLVVDNTGERSFGQGIAEGIRKEGLESTSQIGGEKRSVCARENSAEAVRSERQLSVTDEPPEMRVNREKEPLYRANCIEFAIRSSGLTVHQAIYELAECVQISPVTARRYLKKMVSEAGPLMLGEGPRGHQQLLLRESYWLKS